MSNHEVWQATVDDGRFICRVEHVPDMDEYGGTLTVTVAQTGEVLLTEGVGLAYNALFGPDVADVAMWQDKSITVIDEWIEKQKGAAT